MKSCEGSITSEYVELHCHSYFSLLDGASSPEALVKRAADLGYPALALTDHDGLYGAIRFWQAAHKQGIRPLIGAEITVYSAVAEAHLAMEEGHLTLLAEGQRGYANLCRLISTGQLAGQKGQPRLTLETLADHADGLLCLSGCRQGLAPAALLEKDTALARQEAGQLREVFSGRFWIELQQHSLPTDARLADELFSLAQRLGVPVVATNNVHYAERSGKQLHDVLTCVHHLTTLSEASTSGLLHSNSERFLKSPREMDTLFRDLPQAVRETRHIAERCHVNLDFSAQRLPVFPVAEGHTPISYLRTLCEAGLRQKFDHKFEPITPQARAQLEHELAVIEGTGLAGYFLVVWDIVRYARDQGIRCQGRGSAANSLVAYALDITPVDPLRHELLFERFLSAEARTMPDIDIDFAADRREEVIQYVYERYGEAHVGMVCNVVTFRARSAVRDVAKVLNFPPDVIDRAAKSLDTRSAEAAAEAIANAIPQAEQTESPDTATLPWQTLAELVGGMEGIPRHLSIHAGGILITSAPLVEVVPVERATMPGRVVVQWDKYSVEDAGLIKIDLLSLRTLGMVEEALVHIRQGWGVTLDLDQLPLDDPSVYTMLQEGDTVGCFQVESRAQIQMLPKMLPQRFEDIIIEVALLRPGPIQGNMVHPYLRRRQGLEPVSYVHPALETALAETLGVMVFQEQVIRVAVAIAGFSPGDADRLRRAISRSRSQAEMVQLGVRFMSCAQANGVDEVTAAEIFRQLAAFSGYGFCKSHAAAFALVAYQTLYLKAHYPAAFFCAILNHQPMGFYSPDVLVGDARRHGVPVLPPDVNRSQEGCRLEIGESGFGDSAFRASAFRDSGPAVRLGLRYVRGLGEAWQSRIVQQRGEQPFQDLRDFCRRTRLSRALVENLVRAGALDGLGGARRELLWELGGLIYAEEELDIEVSVEPVALPDLNRAERMMWEVELLGLVTDDHVMSLYRGALEGRGVLTSGELGDRRDGDKVRVAGRVVVRQRPPSAKGFVFITLEDEAGLVNLVVRPKVYERYRGAVRNSGLLLVEGHLQREGEAFSVMVHSAVGLAWPNGI
jgi:error-prone DNA polymerase